MYSKRCCYHECRDISPNTLKEIHHISKLKVGSENTTVRIFFNSAKVLDIMVNID